MLRRGGRAGAHWWRNVLRECARKIILARNLLRQTEAWSQVPVRLSVPQGTGKASSAVITGVWTSDSNYNTAVEPTNYVWNVFSSSFSTMNWLKVVSTIYHFDNFKTLLTSNIHLKHTDDLSVTVIILSSMKLSIKQCIYFFFFFFFFCFFMTGLRVPIARA